MIHLAIAEDHQSLIDGIELLLKQEEDINIVGTANNGEDLIKIVELKQPNVVLIDIKMPKLDGIEATRIIKKRFPYINILAFSMFNQNDAVEQMMEAGATGYILKSAGLDEVLEALKSVYKGKKYFDKDLDLTVLNLENSAKKSKSILTTRQTEILSLIALGKTTREIAENLFIGVQTVETHRKNIMRVLGLRGKGELLRYALEKKYRFKD